MPAAYPAEAVHQITASVHPAKPWQERLGLLAPFLAAGSRRFVTDWQWLDAAEAQALVASLPADIDRIVVFRLYLHDIAQSLAAAYPLSSVVIDIDDWNPQPVDRSRWRCFACAGTTRPCECCRGQSSTP